MVARPRIAGDFHARAMPMAPSADARRRTGRQTAAEMQIINHTHLPRTERDGCREQLVAGPSLGVAALSAHLCSLAAGAATPLRVHAGVCVVLVLDGFGKQRLAGSPQSFHGPCTLVVPAGTEHQIVNTGVTPLQLVLIDPT